ncbi:unnamed protein product [Leptosia nina]|uniref:Uncharacterized protein n=1 Tax=Leptosia nina TaxID=320188 RepID=A0AAV1JEM5_9NEOP
MIITTRSHWRTAAALDAGQTASRHGRVTSTRTSGKGPNVTMPVYYGGFVGGPHGGGYCLYSNQPCNPTTGGCGPSGPLPGPCCPLSC